MNIFTIVALSSIYISLFTFFFWILILFDLKEPKKSKRKYSITFIIPTYNEEKNIEKTIRSVLNLNYEGKKKIIVVDDKSTDRTREICKKYERRGIIKFIEKKVHNGKVPSINIALKHVDTDLFVILDADTYFEKNAVKKLVNYFDDQKVGAVLAALKVENKRGFVQRLQSIEYLFSIFLRKISTFYNGLYTTHGATIFRTSAVRKVGKFDEKNPTEDMDMALRLIKNGYRIESDLNASAYTIVPNTFIKLFKQRLRWYGGFIYNSIIKHRDMLFKKKYAGLNFITYPLSYFWIFIAFLLIYGITVSAFNQLVLLYKLFVNTNVIGFILSNHYTLNVLTALSSLSLGIFLLTVYIMKSKVREKISVLSVVLYIVFFSFITSLFWVASFPKAFLGKKGWKS